MDEVQYHEQPVKGNTVRFAVGSADGLRSSTWVAIGDEKGNVYVSVRNIAGDFKVSLHASRNCNAGFTTQSAKTIARESVEPSRHLHSWKLADDQVVCAFRILIPKSELRAFSTWGEKQMAWLPCAPRGMMTVIAIYICEPAVDIFPNFGPGVHPVGVMHTGNRTTWITYSFSPYDVHSQANVNHTRESLKDANPEGKLFGPDKRALIFATGDHNQGPLLCEHAMDPERGEEGGG